MSGREMLLEKRLAREREQEFELDMVPPSDSEDHNAKTASELAAEARQRLKRLFQKYPMKKTRYDEDCLDMCIPGTEAIT